MNKDNDLFDKIKKELPVALLGDILDEIGLHHQFLLSTSPKIRQL
ncbi:hypothetical protein AB7W97_13695 [Providencia rettgeri]